MHIPTDIQGIYDPIPFLQIFSERIRDRLLAAAVGPIEKRSVEQYLWSTGQIFSDMGAGDHQNNKLGKLEFYL